MIVLDMEESGIAHFLMEVTSDPAYLAMDFRDRHDGFNLLWSMIVFRESR